MKIKWLALILSFMPAFIILPHLIKKETCEIQDVQRPCLPAPVCVERDPISLLPLPKDSLDALKFFYPLIEHPWIRQQPHVKEISLEMIRDTEQLEQLTEMLAHSLAKEGVDVTVSDVVTFLSDYLRKLCSKIPFVLPEECYRVLCIEEQIQQTCLRPFKVYERLYLGENSIHFPFYLDVRVFDCANSEQAEEIVQWHKQLLSENTFHQQEFAFFIGKGLPSEKKNLATHGFASLQGERGIFLYPCLKENQLFLLFAEAPWETFKELLLPLIPKIKIN